LTQADPGFPETPLPDSRLGPFPPARALGPVAKLWPSRQGSWRKDRPESLPQPLPLENSVSPPLFPRFPAWLYCKYFMAKQTLKSQVFGTHKLYPSNCCELGKMKLLQNTKEQNWK